jgi:hypothetical protein
MRVRATGFALAAMLLVAVLPSCEGSRALPTKEESLARPRLAVRAGTTEEAVFVGAPPPDATYDLRDLTSTAYPFESSFPLSFGSDDPGERTVVVGGTVLGQAPSGWTWDEFGENLDSVGAALLIHGTGYLVSYDLRADDVFDGFRPRPAEVDEGKGDEGATVFLIEGCHMTHIRDDGVENDQEMSGTIRDCLFDGINMGVSIGQAATNPEAVTRIEDSVFIFRPMPNANAPDDLGHAVLFKQEGEGSVVMQDVVICYEETPIGPERLRNWMPGSYENVTIVLGQRFDGDGDGDVTDLDHPTPLPAGVTQERDWARCESARTDWLSRHPAGG